MLIAHCSLLIAQSSTVNRQIILHYNCIDEKSVGVCRATASRARNEMIRNNNTQPIINTWCIYVRTSEHCLYVYNHLSVALPFKNHICISSVGGVFNSPMECRTYSLFTFQRVFGSFLSSFIFICCCFRVHSN